MNVAGPSRARPGRLPLGRRVESTYEEDLLELLLHFSLDERENPQTYYDNRTRDGYALSDRDLAVNLLLQQARELTIFNGDRALAQHLAAEEGIGVQDVPRRGHQTIAAPQWQPNPNRPLVQRNRDQLNAVQQPIPNQDAVPQNGNLQNAEQQPDGTAPARNGTQQSQTWGQWFLYMVGWTATDEQPTAEAAPSIDEAAPTPPAVNRPTGQTCVICQDPIFGSEIRAPCGHYYDIACVTNLFQSATRDETLYPPRCCRQNIPVAQVRPHLSQALITEFQQKSEEFSTLKRVFCSSPTCSRFLGPVTEGLFIGRVYDCPAPTCTRRTCGSCRGEYSKVVPHVCRPDADAAQVLTLGRTAGWSRCPGCSQMIELNVGCFHMTCRCRTEFCYLCRALWKSCRCPQWDEARLLAAAEQRVDAQLGVGQGIHARRAVPVQEARRAHARAPAPVAPAVPAPAPAPAAPVARLAPAPAPVAPAPRRVPPPPVPEWRQAAPVVQAANQRVPAPVVPVPTVDIPERSPPTVAIPEWRQAARPVQAANQRVPAPVVPVPAVDTAERSTATVPRWRHATPVVEANGQLRAAVVPDRPPVRATSEAPEKSPAPVPDWRQAAPRLTPAVPPKPLQPPTIQTPTAVGSHASSPVQALRNALQASVEDAQREAVRQRMIRETVARLREDHDCDHGHWLYQRGSGPCEFCGDTLPNYVH
ncbi:hypothetical protein BDN67DRAFT_967585, partial [Paxillus ammoniavirescens]